LHAMSDARLAGMAHSFGCAAHLPDRRWVLRSRTTAAQRARQVKTEVTA
jgi:hypothetical protein